MGRIIGNHLILFGTPKSSSNTSKLVKNISQCFKRMHLMIYVKLTPASFQKQCGGGGVNDSRILHHMLEARFFLFEQALMSTYCFILKGAVCCTIKVCLEAYETNILTRNLISFFIFQHLTVHKQSTAVYFLCCRA